MSEKSEKKYRRRWGDRKDGRLLRTLSPLAKVAPYIMKHRNDATNLFRDSLDITQTEEFLRDLRAKGYKNISVLHVILASYIRTLTSRPGLNRFVSGQRIYARNNIEVIMAIKCEMSIEGEETMIKVVFEPTDTIIDVYEKFNKVVEQVKAKHDETDFDKTARIINYIPRLLLRFTVGLLNFLDYFGLIPAFLLKVSPFHGSMIITSMGSLGIPPIYHHLYNFGNLPAFVSYGSRQTKTVFDAEGKPANRSYIDITVVTDERICDGYYYASAFKILKRYIKNPAALLTPPDKVETDID